ncbi:sushi, nidogen and EGF-like domain-containing protein 1 [Saccostrea cucullata]|uniref:sushi, nidogen and EGF-like domain-containing protein 1 n=1 Tax=Saccostrea cuccullata TaxID=36930 RepID=UPI002ED2E59E
MDLGVINFLLIFSQFLINSQQYENLASRKPVKVSSRYNYGYFSPSKAVDGDKSTYLLECALTASGQKEAWLTVDLGENKNIASISILHGGFGLDASSLRTSDSGIYADTNGDGPVFAANSLRRICLDSFDAKDAQVVCLAWGFLPDSPLHSKSIDSSSAPFYENKLNCAGNEVNINRCIKGSYGCPSGSAVAVKCQKGNTLSGFSVYVSDTEDWRSGTLCYQHDIQQIPHNNVTVDCVTYGRYVTVYNAKNTTSFPNVSDFSYINICEIEVKGCDLGFYGGNCTSKCPQNCLNNTCHSQIGECFECNDGYSGQYCETECPAGKYGQGCSLHCGPCINNTPCNHVNGSCPGECSPGWRGDKCDQECDPGHFGLMCKDHCSPHCLDPMSCDHVNGSCDGGCRDGWIGSRCRKLCASTFYGVICNQSCSNDCRDNICNPETGHCIRCNEGRSGEFCQTGISTGITKN